MIPLFTALGGGLGAAARFGMDKLATHLIDKLRDRRSAKHPSETVTGKRLWGGWGIIFVNITGCFLVGWVATSPWLDVVMGGPLQAQLPTHTLADVLQAGFLGAYTTFSTAIMDTIGYTWKPKFDFVYAVKATLLIGVVIFICIGAALAGVALNTGVFVLPNLHS